MNPTPTPVILPLPPVLSSSIERFVFPEVPEPRECLPTPESPRAIWPACNDAATTRACAKAADGILHRLSLERPTVVAFTSPGEGDGTTSVLIALAPQVAKRIAGGLLVVDANFGHPNLTARLGVPACETAATSVLIYPTNVPHLNVLPVAAKLRFRSYDPASIEELREAWPLVLLDTASLTHPEAAPIVRFCDGVYLVVRLGHTPRRAVAEAARVIHTSGGRLLGCVAVG